MIKDAGEIALIKKSASLSDRVLKKVIKELKPGVTEKETAAKIHYLIESGGAESFSFPCIVAFGSNSALPHHSPGKTKLKKNDIALIDMGSRFDGYCSDITRTTLLGNVPSKAKEIYRIVKEAQAAALGSIRPGIHCSEIDGIARKIIADAGYGEFFNHNLGHSLGLVVHERPSFAVNDNTVLKPGMLMTVEPGIYIDGLGGVRIEDLILVTEKGHKMISRTPRQKI